MEDRRCGVKQTGETWNTLVSESMSEKHGGRYEDGAVARWLSSESLSKPWEIQPSFQKEPVIHV